MNFYQNSSEMIFKSSNKRNALINSMLKRISNIYKPQRDFFIEIMFLFLSIKGRFNFLQFGRYGKFGEQRYRQQFEKQFDFLKFNREITLTHAGTNLAIAFDPSYISKSGKKTPGLDKFWSGVAGQAKLGLEIGGIAAIDIYNKTAFHLEAIQTPTYKDLREKGMTLLDWYADVLTKRADDLLSISKYLVADAYFSKKPFCDKILGADMELISRFRNDADLMYLYKGGPTGKKGRPKKYSGKVNLKNIDEGYFEMVHENDQSIVYSAIVYSKALKRNIKLVYEQLCDKKNKAYLLFFSTDSELDALEILRYYKNRFQIEFLYRDGKQHTGLNDCQARCEKKLHFHFNASLTAINLAKVEHWISTPKEKRGAFSMADIKTMNHNALLLDRFIDVFAVPAYKLKKTSHIRELINFGKIAA
jgi:hypothetical protein